MRIIFCNITYLRYYDGRIAGELTPEKGGRWVKENEDAHEKWNFLNMDGMCYGYVQGSGDQIHIERIDPSFTNMQTGEDITVVWCAMHPETGETVIVGWYEHATAHRFLEYTETTPITGIDRAYWFCTQAENAYLIPEDERNMVIGRAAKTGTGTGFGQNNYWYADNDTARKTIIPSVEEYINQHRENRINTLSYDFDNSGCESPLSEEELEIISEENAEVDNRFLQLSYRMYMQEPSADNAYRIAASLACLFQYTKAIEWYKKTIELDPDDWNTKGILAYVYMQCKRYDDAIALAEELLKTPRGEESDFRDEIYCMLADGFYFKNDITNAVKWQNKILDESKNRELIEHTKSLKADWLDEAQKDTL